MNAFNDLAYDLENFCADFLSGNGKEFLKYIAKAKEDEKLSGFQKISANTTDF